MTPRLLAQFLSIAAVIGLLQCISAHASVLFLAHFDKPGATADYAADGVLSGIAMNGTHTGQDGVFAGAADVGYSTQPGSILFFPSRGHLDPRQGTIEFFVRTKWDWTYEQARVFGHPMLLVAQLQNGGYIHV